jgi:ATP-binding cassette subfamily B protein
MLPDLVKIWSKFRAQVPYLPKAIRLIRQASGPLTLYWVLLTVLQGILPVAFIWVIRLFVDKLTGDLKTVNEPGLIIPLLLPDIIMIALLIFLAESARIVNKLVRLKQGEQVRNHIQDLIHQQSLRLDLAFFESADYYNKLFRARVDAISRPVALLENLGLFIQNLITLVSILALLAAYKWWLPFVLVFGAVIAFPALVANTLRFHKWRVSMTEQQRKTDYFSYILTERETAAEIRLFNLGNYFKDLFLVQRKKILADYLNISRKEMFTELFALVTGLLVMGAVMYSMLAQLVAGKLTLGFLTMFYISFDRCQKAMNILMSNTSEIYKNIIFIENLFEFLEIKPELFTTDSEGFQEIKLEKSVKLQNVYFSYPLSNHAALADFTMEIPAGKITAVVGTNGAGKSTLIKLLCRFYDPDSGTIEIDGKDYKAFGPEKIQKQITVLFQEHLRFFMTVKENIGLGDISAGLPEIGEIIRAAENSGADKPIGLLPEKYENMLGRFFSGAELSTGEWQLIAIARAFIRNTPLLILDEPTSAMDPWAEAKWLQRFKEISRGKTVVLITHRFSTARQADLIYVMDQGTVLESGSHNELMKLGGKYAFSWNQQGQQFQNIV